MTLEGRNAVIYGAGGSIGGAVARAFAREGARVHLTGRTLKTLEVVAEEIRSAGGLAETAALDALDEQAIDAHADAVAAEWGSLDISFNVINHNDVQGTPMADMDVEDYLAPVVTCVRTNFITQAAAVRRMPDG
jgi:NAD(P)-dependent dehydrogenase (short-subunit alcohol dehydrogenase family)